MFPTVVVHKSFPKYPGCRLCCMEFSLHGEALAWEWGHSEGVCSLH